MSCSSQGSPHLSTRDPPMILALVKLSSGDQSFFWSSLDKLLRSVAPRRSCLAIKILTVDYYTTMDGEVSNFLLLTLTVMRCQLLIMHLCTDTDKHYTSSNNGTTLIRFTLWIPTQTKYWLIMIFHSIYSSH